MRYLEIFGIPLLLCSLFNCSIMAGRGFAEGIYEETFTNSVVTAIEEIQPEEVANVEQETEETQTFQPTMWVERWVPEGRGSVHTMMGWQLVTCQTSNQYRLREDAGEYYDENGFAKINDRFVVATKPFYGTVGDYIDVYKANGEIIHCIIGDQKGIDGGGDEYGHADGSIIEFVVDMYRWYGPYNGTGNYLHVSNF